MSPRCRSLSVALALLALASCKSGAKRGEEPAPTVPAAALTAAAPAAPAQDRADDGKAAAGHERKIIRTGALAIEVDDYEKVRGAIDRLVHGAGGFVASVDVARQEGSVGGATLVLRIPEAALDGTVAALSRLGTLEREWLRAEDVSETYYDLAARLRNGKRLEERMVELAAKAGGVKDLLEVERELGRVRESIEVMEGQLRGLDDRASLATLTVELLARHTYQPVEEQTLAGKIADAFEDSVRGLADAAEGLLLFLVAALPWLLPIGALAWLLRRRLGLRLRRRP